MKQAAERRGDRIPAKTRDGPRLKLMGRREIENRSRRRQRSKRQAESLRQAEAFVKAPWSREERDWMIAARARGMGYREIARELQRTFYAVCRECDREMRRRKIMEREGIGKIALADCIERSGLSYQAFAAAVGGAKSTIYRMANQGLFPSRGADGLKKRIEIFTVEKGLTDGDKTAGLWRPVSAKRTRRKEMHNRLFLGDETLAAFGLHRDPFGLEPGSLDEVFRTKDTNRILKILADAVRCQGWVALVGDIGAGKTTLVRTFMESFRKQNNNVKFWRPAFADMGRLTARAICEDLCRLHDQRPANAHTTLYRQVERILAEEARLDHYTVLVIDEAHRVNVRTLSALKNLYEMRDDERPLSRLVAIILVGQPPLKDRMERNHDVREVAERLRVVAIPAFGPAVPAYLQHRVRYAGGDASKIFEPDAVKQIAKLSRTPQEAGNIAAAAMEKTALHGEKKVGRDKVVAVTTDEALLRVVDGGER